jgi:ferredoxin
MATFKTADEEREVPDGTKLEPIAEGMDIPFGCHNGVCGACVVTVLEGMENLEAKNEAEEDFDLEGDQRMMCQCTINGGTVVVDA